MAVGVVSVVVVVVAAIAFLLATRTLRETRLSQSSVQQTRDAIEQVQQILSTLQDAETGERGFLITGQEGFLEPYNKARQTLDQRLAGLQRLFTDPQSHSIGEELAARARAQMRYLDGVIQVRRTGNSEAAQKLVSQELGKQQMDAIRNTIDLLEERERALLMQRQAEWNRTSDNSERVIRWSFFVALCTMMLAGGMLATYAKRQLLADRDAKRVASLLRSTVESVTQGVVVFDQDSRLVAWNQQYLHLRRLDGGRLQIGGDISQIQGGAMPMVLHVDGAAHDSRASSPGFGDLSKPFDGEGIYADGHVLRISGRPAAFGHYVVTVTDITALKKSEAAYRDQAVRLSSILHNIEDAIVTINEVGNIESWSKGAERLFGYSEAEVVSRNFKMLMPETQATAHDRFLNAYLQTGIRQIMGQRRDIAALHKDGRRLDVELSVTEIHVDSRRLFIGVVRDISQRIEVERLKSEFVSTVSHELRTPLTSIAGALGLVEGTLAAQLPAQATRLIQIAKQNSDRLVRLINDILDLEKSAAGKLEFKLEEQPLGPIVQQAVEINRAYAHSHHASIQFDRTSDDAVVLVDRDRFVQVLTNLLSNAAKFSPRDGVIRVDIKNADGDVCVTVQDEGPGISGEFRTRIFQKFAQADASDSRAKGGTGLGLSIAKSIVERLGGSIGYDANAKKGACFFVSLPIKAEIAGTRREA